MDALSKMNKRVFTIVRHFVVLSLAMFYGMLVVSFQLPPYQFLQSTYTALKLEEKLEIPKEYLETPKEYLETDVAEIITISQPGDVFRLRNKLITFLWGTPELPSLMPSEIAEGFTDPRYTDISSLGRIDRLSIVMEYGLVSNIYHFIPKTPNNKVILYHQGHEGDFFKSKEQFTKFLDSGYSVIAFSMPLNGLNNNNLQVKLPRFGILKVTNHDRLKFLSPKSGHPVKYFIEPVVIVLNYLEKNYDYSSISMVGISGGGWTTTLVSAIDTRIKKSFPVSGSYPIYLRSNSDRDWGHYEQTVPELYRTANYLELYILGSYGEKRKQVQVINQYDTCCYAGMKWETYNAIVEARIQKLGIGEYKLFLDNSHKGHKVSNMAISMILDELSSTND
jgi:hypothetical protein